MTERLAGSALLDWSGATIAGGDGLRQAALPFADADELRRMAADPTRAEANRARLARALRDYDELRGGA